MVLFSFYSLVYIISWNDRVFERNDNEEGTLLSVPVTPLASVSSCLGSMPFHVWDKSGVRVLFRVETHQIEHSLSVLLDVLDLEQPASCRFVGMGMGGFFFRGPSAFFEVVWERKKRKTCSFAGVLCMVEEGSSSGVVERENPHSSPSSFTDLTTFGERAHR